MAKQIEKEKQLKNINNNICVENNVVNGKCYVFTAHTMNDQAETVLLRLASGSGIKSISAIAMHTEILGVEVIRPFLK